MPEAMSGRGSNPLERFFRIRERDSTIGRECLGGFTTFLTMAYILVVNPVILSEAGVPTGGAFLATALASAFATVLMGLVAGLPVALAPGMGLNAFFAFTIGAVLPWEAGLGLVVLVSIVFVALTIGRVRAALTRAVPTSLRFAAAVGIGLFIAFIGLKDGGIVVEHPVTLVTIGDLSSTHARVALGGIAVTLVLIARRVQTAIFWGVAVTVAAGWMSGLVSFGESWVRSPTWELPGAELDIASALRPESIVLGLTLLFFALFDAMGTLYAVGAEAKLLDDRGNFPQLGRALLVDATGSLAGGLLGTSSVTCYIESATGVNVGARTGLASVVTGVLFALAIAFSPLVEAIGAGVEIGGTVFHPLTAPALVAVGLLMSRSIERIAWGDITEAFPAFVTIVVMPFTFSIANGLAAGFVTYTVMKVAAGRAREVHWIVYALAAWFAIHFAVLGTGH